MMSDITDVFDVMHLDTYDITRLTKKRPRPQSLSFTCKGRVDTMNSLVMMGANGELAAKMAFACEEFRRCGFTLHAADIVPESQFKPGFSGFDSYYNLQNPDDRAKLQELGRKQSFDVYHATWP